MTDHLAARIRAALPSLELREGEPLSLHTSFRIGGPARILALPGSGEELAALCRLLRSLGEKPLILGNGSNVLAPDEGLDRVVAVTARAEEVRIRGNTMEAECGVSLTALSAKAAKEGLSGLAFAYGIPGTLGGALVMNAGAYGGEIKDVAEETRFLDEELRELLPREALEAQALRFEMHRDPDAREVQAGRDDRDGHQLPVRDVAGLRDQERGGGAFIGHRLIAAESPGADRVRPEYEREQKAARFQDQDKT